MLNATDPTTPERDPESPVSPTRDRSQADVCRAERITARQLQVLLHIERIIVARGLPPTIRELGEAIGQSSTTAIVAHLVALVRAGHLARDARTSRGLRVLVPASAARLKVMPLAKARPVAAQAKVGT